MRAAAADRQNSPDAEVADAEVADAAVAGAAVAGAAGAQPADPLYPHGAPGLLRRLLPRSLLGRAVLIIVTPLILMQVISSYVFYDRHYDTITKRLAQGLAGDVAAVITLLERDPSPQNRSDVFQMARTAMQLRLTLAEGTQLPESAPAPIGTVVESRLQDALSERLRQRFYIDARSIREHVEIFVQLPEGVLRVLVSDERLFSSTTYIFIFWTIGSSILLFGIAVIFMRNQVKPIRRLAHAAESFGKGQEVRDFKPEGATEVRQAAAAFISMRDRIKRQIQQRTEMLAGVSHDLRTPLTRMKLQLEMLPDVPDAAYLQADVAEMEHMVEGYLAFARGEGQETPAPTDLGALLRDVVAQMTRDGRVIDLHVEQNLSLALRRDAMRRCLTNLLANAQRYGKHVAVRAGRRKNLIEITIDDDGPGIPPERYEDVFKPFFRLDHSRNRATGGIGLGLTIARDVARSHGGDVTVEAAPGGGLRARIWLPV